ncbi:MAG TPA: aminotransferase class V-fold PLP-dependent enzyme [Acidimicrobiia bacterium]|nr:aminotransferase class V-fold PLP-dependent enzyme [Acidimicrobiia bacterium]
MSEQRELLSRTIDHIANYREQLDDARVGPIVPFAEIVAGFDYPLGDEGTDPAQVVEELVAAAAPGLTASAGPRYYGFVTGGSLDAALCADLLVSGWDQLAFNAASAPACIAAEVVAARWLKELLMLPAGASVGFVPGGQGANTVSLAAARHHVLAQAGWDDADGLFGAPPIRVFAGAERHATIDRSLRLLGIGQNAIHEIAVNGQGAMDTAVLATAFADEAAPQPTIVCAQAGNVATGAFDDLTAICTTAREHGAWVHVDGAFGLWAAASPATRSLVHGIELADSWGCDGHKWLNVPYDSGFAICAHPTAHANAMRYTASYLTGQDAPPVLAGADLTMESSRRARGMAVWAAIRSLGRHGVANLVEQCCAHARRFARQLGEADGIEIANDVVLNQVLVRFGDDDTHTDRVVEAVQADGTCWTGGATWRGRRFMRISVSNWSTTDDDVDRSVQAMLKLHADVT